MLCRKHGMLDRFRKQVQPFQNILLHKYNTLRFSLLYELYFYQDNRHILNFLSHCKFCMYNDIVHTFICLHSNILPYKDIWCSPYLYDHCYHNPYKNYHHLQCIRDMNNDNSNILTRLLYPSICQFRMNIYRWLIFLMKLRYYSLNNHFH